MMNIKNHAYNELISNFDKMENIRIEENHNDLIEINENINHIPSFNYNYDIKFRRGHRNCATCIDAKMTNSGPKCGTGGKDYTILLWDLNNLKIINSLKGVRNDYLKSNLPSSNISSIFVSENIIFSGCADGKIIIWDIRQNNSNSFIAHKGYITGICHCNTPAHELIDNIDISGDVKKLDFLNYIFTCGHDGIIFQWDLRNTSTHINESKGHVGNINDMIYLGQDKLLTTGSDRTTRLWSINSNTHHIYNGGGECCLILGKKNFISGDDQGNLHFFQKGKKSPIKKLNAGKWITSMGVSEDKILIGTVNDKGNSIDYCAINDKDTSIELGEITKGEKINGTVNGIKVLGNAAFSIIGTNHKYGRWFTESGRNGILVTIL